MTDRHSGYVVTLSHDIREDDAQLIINALKMVKGVVSVTPVLGGSINEVIAEERVTQHWREKLLDFVRETR